MKHSTVAQARPGYEYSKTSPIRSVRRINVHETNDPGDSFQQRIDNLREELTRLNLYDHPVRIVEICTEIQTLRAALKKMEP